MGIDPVTHKPRLDLLQLYSLLNSSLYNSSQLNVSSVLGIGSMLNPNLLNLATSFLSCQGNNQDITPKNFQENQLGSSQVQTQIHCLQPEQLQTHAHASTDSSAQFLNETQLMQANLEQLSDNPTSFRCQNSLQTSWPAMPNWDYHDTNQPIINTSFENLSSVSFSPLLSTPSCSTTPLHSSSATYVNGNVEDDRDSYCSNILMFDMPNCLDRNRLM